MKKCYIKILLGILVLLLAPYTNFYTNANVEDIEGLEITKKLNTGEVEHTNRRINFLGANPSKFWENYHKAHEDLNFRERLASGILEIDDIMNYMVYVVGFLTQLGMLIGVIFIMYAGYKYMVSVFNGQKTGGSTLKNAIIGVTIVIFSYAIMKILTSIIGLT